MARRREWFAVQMILKNGKTYDINLEFKTLAGAKQFAVDLMLEYRGTYSGHSIFTVSEI